VKVVEVQDGSSVPPKLGCSMKVVSQEDGSDLDPNHRLAGRGAGGVGLRGPVSDRPPEAGTFSLVHSRQKLGGDAHHCSSSV
jgi:hypothetical protein